MRWSRCAGLLSLLAALPITDAAAEVGRAEQLFEQGLEDMLAGRYETGCPALAESFRLDPLPGALFTLAECENKWGKVARALAHYRDYVARYEDMDPARQAQQGPRAEVARRQIDDLEARVPTLQLTIDRAPETVVRLDGRILAASEIGVPIAVDPGVHLVEVAQGDRTRETEVALAEGEARRLDLTLPAAGVLNAPVIAGWTLIGFGAAGLVVGTATGAVTLGHKSTIDAECIDRSCSPEGLDAVRTAQVTGAVSTAGFVVGAAAVAAGTVVLVLSDDDAVQLSGGSRLALSWRTRW